MRITSSSSRLRTNAPCLMRARHHRRTRYDRSRSTILNDWGGTFFRRRAQLSLCPRRLVHNGAYKEEAAPISKKQKFGDNPTRPHIADGPDQRADLVLAEVLLEQNLFPSQVRISFRPDPKCGCSRTLLGKLKVRFWVQENGSLPSKKRLPKTKAT